MLSGENWRGNEAPYSFRSLESASHIRILELLPACNSPQDTLVCRLQHVDLELGERRYEAISYYWGDPSMAIRKKIYVIDEGFLLITPNLYSALSRLQQPSESLFLWSDGVCINQALDDAALQERSIQVRMMSRIYSEAKHVIVDLEEDLKDDEILMEGLAKLSLVDEKHWHEVMSSVKGTFADSPHVLAKSFQERQAYYNNLESLASTLDVPHRKHSFWPAFKRLVRRPWFRRVWIVQELSLNEEVSFMLGRRFISADDFEKSIERAFDFQDFVSKRNVSYRNRVTLFLFSVHATFIFVVSWLRFFLAGCKAPTIRNSPDWDGLYRNAIIDLFFTRYSVQLRGRVGALWISGKFDRPGPNPQRLGLLDLFLWYRYSNCLDSRDHVYGLLGLADHVSPSDLYVDYKESSTDLSLRLSLYLIRQDLGRLLLYLANHSSVDLP